MAHKPVYAILFYSAICRHNAKATSKEYLRQKCDRRACQLLDIGNRFCENTPLGKLLGVVFDGTFAILLGLSVGIVVLAGVMSSWRFFHSCRCVMDAWHRWRFHDFACSTPASQERCASDRRSRTGIVRSPSLPRVMPYRQRPLLYPPVGHTAASERRSS